MRPHSGAASAAGVASASTGRPAGTLRRAAAWPLRRALRAIKPNAGLTALSMNPLVAALVAGTSGPVVAKMADGTPIAVDLDDYHGRILWLTGSNDYKVSRTVNALLSPGDVFLDIGANHGTVGFAARHAVGPAGAVHLFEPQPYLCNRVADALAASGARNVTLHRAALFDADGAMILRVPSEHSGRATLLPELIEETDGWATVRVATRAAGATVAPLVAGRPFGLKIDVEGAEPPILSALLPFPNLKFAAFEGDRNEEWLFDAFSGHGFAIFGMVRSLLRPQVARVRSLSEWGAFHDFVAVRETANLPARGSVAAFAQAVREGTSG
ncbi:MAG: FkbM family methyltransferase [Pseudomonadota bacterium]